MGVVTVKVIAPANYRPRTSTFKIGYISEVNTPKFREDETNRIMKEIKSQMEANNPNIELNVSVSVDVTPLTGLRNLL